MFTATAPGRVNLIGEHIDYCDGFVLPFAIDRAITLTGKPLAEPVARLTSQGHPAIEIPLDAPVEPAEPGWSRYVRGVLRGFQDRGHTIPGFEAALTSTIPAGAGLSSSAALELATATLLEALLDTVLPTKEKALLCRQAEHDFAGVPCGIMDQFASAFGKKDHLVLIDCQSGEPELVPFTNPGLTVLVANTMVSHELSDGAYGERRRNTEDALGLLGRSSWRDVALAEVEAAREKLGPLLFRRARHVVTEIQRTLDAVAALHRNDFAALGPLMAASHASLRDDFEVSCRELDLMVELANSIGPLDGVVGARMTGGGFGGSAVILCQTDRAQEILQSLASEYREATGIAPEIFATRPSEGARLLPA